MRWPVTGKKRVQPAPCPEAVVLSVTTPLNRETALEVGRQVERISRDADVVIDLTAIPAFDTDGADTLLALQAAHASGRVSIVGFRQATARLVGPQEPLAESLHEAPAVPGEQESGWVLRRLRNLVVVQPRDESTPGPDGLEATLTDATADVAAAIFVLDLRGVVQLPASAVDAIAFASSTAALRGQELLVVNAGPELVEALRATGLSATTFVAPEPFGEAQPPW
jgi:anti-anti-sigma regulatory factor